MQSWDLDPKTGDYVMVGGKPKETDSLTVPAYIRIKTPRLGWMYARDNTFGSNVAKFKRRESTKGSNPVETAVANALQPMADDGRAESIDVNTPAAARHGVAIDVKIFKANGTVDELKIPGLGV